MPNKARKPCAQRGCKELTKMRYCEKHAKAHMKHYNRHRRDPKSKKRYGKHWRDVRTAYLTANPLCAICWSAGKLTAADTVHHIKPLSEGGNNYWGNLQSLCHSCHSRLHAGNGDYFGGGS